MLVEVVVLPCFTTIHSKSVYADDHCIYEGFHQIWSYLISLHFLVPVVSLMFPSFCLSRPTMTLLHVILYRLYLQPRFIFSSLKVCWKIKNFLRSNQSSKDRKWGFPHKAGFLLMIPSPIRAYLCFRRIKTRDSTSPRSNVCRDHLRFIFDDVSSHLFQQPAIETGQNDNLRSKQH